MLRRLREAAIGVTKLYELTIRSLNWTRAVPKLTRGWQKYGQTEATIIQPTTCMKRFWNLNLKTE